MNSSLLTLLSDYNPSGEPITPQSDLLADLGIWGDDAIELLEKYGERFGVIVKIYGGGRTQERYGHRAIRGALRRELRVIGNETLTSI